MENLKLSGFRVIEDPSLSQGLSCFTLDSLHNKIYGITKINQILSIDQKSEEVKTLESITHERVSDSFSLHVELFSENDVLNIYFDNGNILTYSLESGEINCVGFVEEGIAAVASSPDQESIALISKSDKLFLFTRSFDVLAEKDLHLNHSESIQKVDVGWGSKKTQFHGSEGKEAAKEEGEPLEPPVGWDDQKRRICWRGDGLYFVTSAINPEKNHRVLRIWSNEGLLQYESEYVAGLEHSLAWRPEGNLIVSSRFYKDVHEIVFFEKNGLRHGQFTLSVPHRSFIIKHLLWSTDSYVLLIHGFNSLEKRQIIFLYSMRNYHYYLKKCYKFSDDVELVAWDLSSRLTFSIFASTGSIKQYSHHWVTNYSDGTAAVIDGCKVQLTPFNHVNIPPPMSAYSFIFESPINELHIYSPQLLLVYSSDDELILCQVTQSIKRNAIAEEVKLTSAEMIDIYRERIDHISSEEEVLESNIKIESNVRSTAFGSCVCKVLFRLPGLPNLHHLCLIDERNVIAIRKNDLLKNDLIKIQLNDKQIIKLAQFDSEVLIMDYLASSKLIALQFADHSVKQMTLINELVSDWMQLPVKLIQMAIVMINLKLHLFGLSQDGTLYFDRKAFIKYSCSSFLIHQGKFLVTTGSDHKLRCNFLDTYFIKQVLPTGIDERDDPRSIERRSKLVISIEEDARVILQMPRGNLESIHPRVLLLALLKQLLDSCQYGHAFNLMKKHRINLNLLVDHDLISFSQDVETVINQIGKNVQDICLFLSELSREQVHKTMYKFAYNDKQRPFDNKLSKICCLMRNVMTKMDPDRYLIPILVTFVKEEPPSIDQALRMIFSLEDEQTMDEALRYMTYLIDTERLCKEALGTYDSNIYLMVANKTNKDPKEYLAYIKKLRAHTNIYYRQFIIDVDLKRFDKALVNMSELKDDCYREVCLNFIKTNRLFWSAVANIPSDHPWIQSIWEMFADYLLIKRYYEEAGIAYQKAKSINNAIKAFQLAENWQTAIELALSLPDYDIASLCRSFVTRLVTNRKCLDAAYIQEIYLKDRHSAILTLIEGRHWAEASRLLGMEPNDALHCTLQAELSSEAYKFVTAIKRKRSDLESSISRLKIIEEARFKSLENEPEQIEDENDIYSDTSSISDSSSSRSVKSRGDGMSLVTRKTRHKAKKQLKKYSLKEGSANEDIALRKLIRETMESCVTMAEEAQTMIRWLYFYDAIRLATWCQTDLSALYDYIHAQVKVLWPDPEEAIQSPDQSGISAMKRIEHFAFRCLKEPEAFVPPKLNIKPWKLTLIQDKSLSTSN